MTISFHTEFDLSADLAEMDDLRSRLLKSAWMSFESQRIPGVAYSKPEMVERRGSHFFEWKPVGFTNER